MNADEIRIKIRKLLALAGSPNEHEASSAATMARNLADKYNLSVYECGKEEQTSEITGKTVTASGRFEPWKIDLFCNLAREFDCYPTLGQILEQRGSRCVKLRSLNATGYPTDIELVGYTYEFLIRVIMSEFHKSLAIAKRDGLIHTKHDSFNWKASFCEGCCVRILDRIKEDRFKGALATTKEMVLARKAEVNSWVDENLKLRRGKLKQRRHAFNNSAFAAGTDAGNRIQLKKAVNM